MIPIISNDNYELKNKNLNKILHSIVESNDSQQKWNDYVMCYRIYYRDELLSVEGGKEREPFKATLIGFLKLRCDTLWSCYTRQLVKEGHGGHKDLMKHSRPNKRVRNKGSLLTGAVKVSLRPHRHWSRWVLTNTGVCVCVCSCVHVGALYWSWTATDMLGGGARR